ncbi:MAG: hypothetical protein IJX39_01330 [Clostridia bacterium]|nr:hypothetical protein [Clostridia bacterium]
MEKQVLKYEEEPIVKDQIVFYGPSNFTRWGAKYGMKPLREVLLGKSGAPCAINRGFGSSCAEHQLYYYHRMVRPLEPRVLVYSGSGNAMSFGYTPEETFELAQRVVMYALTDFPDIHIYLCDSNAHKKVIEGYDAFAEKYDKWMKEFAERTPNCVFIDAKAYKPLRRTDIYVEDGVHFNQTGYDLYTDFFKEALKDELDRY